ncbi:MAG TPA: LysR family transcriptional regulator [Candidatus Elarobacter sp.]|jgi:hypothetical protein
MILAGPASHGGDAGGASGAGHEPLSLQPRRDSTAPPGIPDLRRLYAFVVVAEELHFRRAAIRLAMAQSPLSRVIKALERDLGVTLFRRTRRTVQLTPAGEALLADARDLIERAEQAVARARGLQSSEGQGPP